ncbi:MAG: GNAT family N-acetyltransferase [Bacteroidales bacterium]|nr:GNAT family N-acetyltransferase [Bacteroidales bacterium]
MNILNCIVTDRLILRPLVKGDELDVDDIMKDDYTARMAGFKPFKSMEESFGFIRRWKREGFAITERTGNTVIGLIQFPINHWSRTTYVGYMLHKDYRGNGYMTEAVEAVKEYVFTST